MTDDVRVPTRDRRSSDTTPQYIRPFPPKEWSFLFYLCGDHDDVEQCIEANLMQLASVGSSEQMHVVVQRDRPAARGGAERFVLQRPCPEFGKLKADLALGAVDTGTDEALTDFLTWALRVCPSRHVALVVGGMGVFEPGSVSATFGRRRSQLFSFCDDASSGSALDLVDLDRALRASSTALPNGRKAFDILALDICHLQFLEVAYQLDGVVDLLLAPQTSVPMAGWRYDTVLLEVQGYLSDRDQEATPASMAKVLVKSARASYGDPNVVLAALDLARLPQVTQAFDAVMVTMLEWLGEDVVWWGRRGVIDHSASLRVPLRSTNQENDPLKVPDIIYDLGRLMEAIDREMTNAAEHAVTYWLSDRLDAARRLGRLWQFRPVAARLPPFDERDRLLSKEELQQLAACFEDDPDLRTVVPSDSTARGDVERLLVRTLGLARDALPPGLRDELTHGDGVRTGDDDRGDRSAGIVERLADAVAAARGAGRLADYRPFAERFGAAAAELNSPVTEQLLASLNACFTEAPCLKAVADALAPETRQHVETVLAEAVQQAQTEPGGIEAVELNALETGRRHAQIIAQLAERLRAIIAPASANALSSLPRFVVALERGEVELSGVCLYRPQNLDEVAFLNYLDLRFHERIRWVAYLAACNMIESHPRALWRLVGSLLNSTSARTRDAVLNRLAGPRSAGAGLWRQFQSLAAPPALKLALEVARDQPADTVVYRLRFDGGQGSATIAQQVSVVEADALKAVLAGLDTLLGAATVDRDALDRIRALGSQLGEDVLQRLESRLAESGRTLPPNGDEAIHLQLQMPPELMRYPWELLCDRQGWLCRRYALGRQVTFDAQSIGWDPVRWAGPIRPLIIGNPIAPGNPCSQRYPDLLDAAGEAEFVAELFEGLCERSDGTVQFDRNADLVQSRDLSGQELRGFLRSGRYTIVHFAGHAVYDERRPERSGWILADGCLSAASMCRTLAWREPRPWLFFANACSAAMEPGGGDTNGNGALRVNQAGGLASSFLSVGVSAYIAPLWPVSDGLARHVAERFYEALLTERRTIGQALQLARSSVADRWQALVDGKKKSGATHPGIGWLSFVLYGDPTVRLWSDPGNIAPTAGRSAAAPE